MAKVLTTRRKRCPQCGAAAGVRIVYGLPSSEAFEAEERGEIVLGGCLIEEDAPTHARRECGSQWKEGGPSRPPRSV